jgi:hypothetical protein
MRAVQRVEELEDILLRAGLLEQRSNGWHEADLTANAENVSLKRTRDEPEDLGLTVPGADDHASAGGSPTSVGSFVDILRDLSLEAGGGYVGASSNITMGRMLNSIIKAKEETLLSNRLMHEHLSPKSLDGVQEKSDNLRVPLSSVSQPVADRMIYG